MKPAPDVATRESTGKPTLKTISQLSGLAVPTVSRALNDAPDIGSNTKALVRRIAAEIGYVPNRAGVRLRTGRTNVISLVLSTEHDMMNHTARLISSIAGGLQGTPYHMIVTPFFADDDPMKPIHYIVETGSADAIIFNQIKPEDPRVAYLMERGFPFATHGRTIWSDKHPYYDFDNEAFGRLAIQALVKRGRKRLLLIAPPAEHNYGREMLEGTRDEATSAGVALLSADKITSDSTADEVRAYIGDLLRDDPTYDGIIAASANATMAVVSAMEAEGFEVGTDIDVVAKEAIPFLKYFREQIIVVDEDVKEAGEFLARAAMQAIRQPELPPLQGLELPIAPDIDIPPARHRILKRPDRNTTKARP